MRKIYILGSINLDLVMESTRLPEQGETIKGQAFNMHFGGKGANQAVASSKLGGMVTMAGRVGNDHFGEIMLNNLKQYGIDISNIIIDSSSNSGVAIINIVDGDNRIIINTGANEKITFNDVDNLLKQAKPDDLFLTQLENVIDVTDYALKKAKEKEMLVVLNPAPFDPLIINSLQYVDIIIPNENELKQLIQEQDLEICCKKLIEMGPKSVIVTLGDKGYYYLDSEQQFHGRCLKVNVVDTTGAGDTFCGAFVARLSHRASIEDALSFASIAATLSVTKKGAQNGIPSLNEIKEYLNN